MLLCIRLKKVAETVTTYQGNNRTNETDEPGEQPEIKILCEASVILF